MVKYPTMPGRLKEEDMMQLEAWIGTGPKNFTLIHSISRDGCSPTTFHQRCDNQGPTVTVLYNTQGSVFGGYTSVSLSKHPHFYGREIQDNAAFLFQLYFDGKATANKFPVKDKTNAIYYNDNQGPSFGKNGDDLSTFTETIGCTGGHVFALNGSMKSFGSAFECRGTSRSDVCNNNMTVLEMEVYLVTEPRQAIDTTWRNISDETVDGFIDEISSLKLDKVQSGSEIRILFLGPVGSGKSSFINTCCSAVLGRIVQKAICGTGRNSVTRRYTSFIPRTNFGYCLPIRLCDTSGYSEDFGPDAIECNYILDGHIKENFKFSDREHIQTDSGDFVVSPKPGDKVRCGVFVIAAADLEDDRRGIFKKIVSQKELMEEKGIPSVVVLTKVDKLCKDASRVYKNSDVKEAVDTASSLLGISRNNIFPLKNYEDEVEIDEVVNNMAFIILKHIIYRALDGMEPVGDQCTHTAALETTESDVL
ncbi:IFI44-like protein [Mya arenaria]|uniref:IFI44-like protein n=1 Tax=Mya arenaria TaxID=6604 RepID=A0ABY7GA23_MYAAR|nr:interferon-induced protein 44-like isoform X2 [Mya arenaria]WAR31278.1 IFI44-like protein [Mya arenaria]